MTGVGLFASPDEVPATGRPLVVVDVDEVILRFVGPLARFLETRGLELLPRSFALTGNIVRLGGDDAIPATEVKAVLAAFFESEVERQEPVEGAVAALSRLGAAADVVILTNVPSAQAQRRAHHLGRLGIAAPMLANDGAKGPVVARLAARARAAATTERGVPVVFVDDGPTHLASARDAVGDVRLVQFVDDPAWFAMSPIVAGVWLRTRAWSEVEARLDALAAAR